ncbi:MAG: Rieske 2Fe-2S domain-containing protein [Chloroflexota bacterium]
MHNAEKTLLPNTLTRRQFLGVAWLGSVALLALQSVVSLTRFLKPVSSGGFGGLVYAGKVDEFPIGSVNRVLSGRFYLVRNEEGFLALWQRCTHLGCAIPWEEGENQFHCPCHGSLFNTVGEVTGGPAPRPMDYFPVTIRSGEVWVDTSKPTERTRYDPSQVAQA